MRRGSPFLAAVFLGWTSVIAAEAPLVGTWRVVSYLTSDGELLRRHGRPPGPLVWWLNHRLLENPPEDQRPRMLEGLPDAVLAGLREGKPLLRDDPRVEIPKSVGCLICQRYSGEPHDIPDEPPVADALVKPAR